MSLQGIRIGMKVIEQMESAEEELRKMTYQTIVTDASQQDDKIRSIVRIKSAELQDELAMLLGHQDVVKAAAAG